MNRRDFVKYLALTAAGTAALPAQIHAFENYYEANTPFVDRLIAIDDIFLCGNASRSTRMQCDFYIRDKIQLPLAVNCFGGICAWSAAPDQKIIAGESDFFWRFHGEGIEAFTDNMRASISWIGDDLVRKRMNILRPEGSLSDYVS